MIKTKHTLIVLLLAAMILLSGCIGAVGHTKPTVPQTQPGDAAAWDVSAGDAPTEQTTQTTDWLDWIGQPGDAADDCDLALPQEELLTEPAEETLPAETTTAPTTIAPAATTTTTTAVSTTAAATTATVPASTTTAATAPSETQTGAPASGSKTKAASATAASTTEAASTTKAASTTAASTTKAPSTTAAASTTAAVSTTKAAAAKAGAPADAQEVLNRAALHPQKTNDAELDALVQQIFGRIFTPGMTTYDKVVACYNYLIHNAEYGRPSQQAALTAGNSYRSAQDKRIVLCAKRILNANLGVCDDYSAAFLVMTRAIGLDCYYTHGFTTNTKGETRNHIWATITVGGVDYIFDPQVEDKQSANGIKYTFFCKTYDSSIAKIYSGYDLAADKAAFNAFRG